MICLCTFPVTCDGSSWRRCNAIDCQCACGCEEECPMPGCERCEVETVYPSFNEIHNAPDNAQSQGKVSRAGSAQSRAGGK